MPWVPAPALPEAADTGGSSVSTPASEWVPAPPVQDAPASPQGQWTPAPVLPPLTMGDRIKQAIGSATRDFIGGVGSTPIGAGAIADIVGVGKPIQSVLHAIQPDDPDWRDTMSAAQAAVTERFKKSLSPDEVPGLEDSFWNTKIPGAIGNVASLMVGAGIPGLLSRGTIRATEIEVAKKVAEEAIAKGATEEAGKAAGAIAGKAASEKLALQAGHATVAGLVGMQQGASQYEDAKAHGADDNTAWKAFVLGGAAGAGAAYAFAPFGKMVSRIQNATQVPLGKMLISSGAETIQGALMSVLGGAAGNLIASKILQYDPDRKLLGGLAEEAASGGVASLLFSLLSHGLARVKQDEAQPTAEQPPAAQPSKADQAPVPPVESGAVPAPEESPVVASGADLNNPAQAKVEPVKPIPQEEVAPPVVEPIKEANAQEANVPPSEVPPVQGVAPVAGAEGQGEGGTPQQDDHNRAPAQPAAEASKEKQGVPDGGNDGVKENVAPPAAPPEPPKPAFDLGPLKRAQVRETVVEKGTAENRTVSNLSKPQKKLFESLNEVDPKEDSGKGRLRMFLESDPTPIIKSADKEGVDPTYVSDRLTKMALDYYIKNGDFKVGEGGFSPSVAQAEIVKQWGRSKKTGVKAESLETPGIADKAASPIIDPLAEQRHAKMVEIVSQIQERAARGLPPIEKEAASYWFKSRLDPDFDTRTISGKNAKAIRALLASKDFTRKLGALMAEQAGEMGFRSSADIDDAVHSISEGFTGKPMEEDAVRAAAEKLIGGKLPANVKIVNDPNARTSEGKPWKARIIRGDKGFTIEINRAFNGSEADVHNGLMEEAVHAVWHDADVQDAWKLVRDSLTPDEIEAERRGGYSDKQAFEEAANRAIRDRWNSQEQRSAWRQFVDAVWGKIKSVLGIKGDALEEAKDRLAARALEQLAKGAKASDEGEILHAQANIFYRHREEAIKGSNEPGVKRQELLDSAASQAKLFDSPAGAEIDRVRKNPTTEVERKTGTALGKIASFVDMSNLGNGGLLNMPHEMRDVTANAILETDAATRNHAKNLRDKIPDKLGSLNDALAKIPDLNEHNVAAARAKSLQEYIFDNSEKYIQNRIELAKKSDTVEGRKTVELERARRELDDIRKYSPESLKVALETIAGHIPGTVHNDFELLGWLSTQSRDHWPAFGGVAPMNDAIARFLIGGDPVHGIEPALMQWRDAQNTPSRYGASEKGILSRIYAMNILNGDAKAARKEAEQFTDFFRGLNGQVKKTVSTGQMLKEYHKQRSAYEDAAAKVKDINHSIGLAYENFEAATKAADLAEQVVNSPEYGRVLQEARDQLDSRSKGIIKFGEVKVDGKVQLDGSLHIQSPLDESQYHIIDLSPSKEANDGAIATAQKVLGEIATWLSGNPTDASRKEVYEKVVKPLLETRWMGGLGADALMGNGGTHYGPFSFSARAPFWSIGKALGFIGKAAAGTTNRKVLYNMVGGKIGQMLTDYMTRTDWAYKTIRDIESNPNTTSTKQKRLALDAAMQGGFVKKGFVYRKGVLPDESVVQGLLRWSDEVLNPLLARNQSPGGRALEVGEYTPNGHKITHADMAAAKAQKGYVDALHDALKSTASAVLKYLPLATESEKFFRQAIDYGLKMPRSISDYGYDFAAQWKKASEADEKASQGKSTPVIDERFKLLQDQDNFERIVNNWWGTTNPEYWQGYGDHVQKTVANEAAARATSSGQTFQDVDDLLNHFGQRRADLINAGAGKPVTDALAQRDIAKATLVKDINHDVFGILGHPGDGELPGRDVQGVGKPIVDATSAKSSLTTPRGRMVASDGFYDYSITEDGRRLRLNASAMLAFQKQEYDAVKSSLVAIHKEIGERETNLANLLKKASGLPEKMLTQQQYEEGERTRIKAGDEIVTLRALKSIETALGDQAKAFESNMQAAVMDEKGMLLAGKKLEAVTSVGKLASSGVQFTNMLSAAFFAPVKNGYAMGRGRFGVLDAAAALVKASYVFPRELIRGIASFVGVDTALAKSLAKNPDMWMGAANTIHRWVGQYASDLEYLNRGGYSPADGWRHVGNRFLLNMGLPETAGYISRDQAGIVKRTGTALLNFLSQPLQVMSTLGGELTAKGEQLGTIVQHRLNMASINSMKPDIIRAFDIRESKGLNQLSPPVKFNPAELGFRNNKGLESFRKSVAPAGNIETAFLDYYNRTKGQKDPLSIPLFADPSLERAVLVEMQKNGNIISDSGKPDALKGKGWKGFFRGGIGRFQQYPMMLTMSTLGDLSQNLRDKGMMGSKIKTATLKMMAGKITVGDAINDIFKAAVSPENKRDLQVALGNEAAVIMGLLAFSGLALGNQFGRQHLTQLTTGKVPSGPTVEAFAQNPTIGGFAKLFVAGGASLFLPYFGDYLTSLLGGQSRRPGLDLANMVPGIGQAVLLADTVRKIAQTGDAFYPMVNFVKQTSPGLEGPLNLIPAVGNDMALNNSMRALRSAAPDGMEVKPMDTGSGKSTPLSPIMRNLMTAATSGDKAAFDEQFKKAIAFKVSTGQSEADAKKSVLSSIRARLPEVTVFGKSITPEEQAKLVANMTGAQLQSYQHAQETFKRISQWTGKSISALKSAKSSKVKAVKFLTSRIPRTSGQQKSPARKAGHARLLKLLKV